MWIMIHVLPLNDLREHEETTTCPCGPVVEWEHAEPLVIHRSWDGREYIEDAERIINGKGENDSR